jgi:hypothetical protein
MPDTHEHRHSHTDRPEHTHAHTHFPDDPVSHAHGHAVRITDIIADANGDELEHGAADFPGQFPDADPTRDLDG